LRRTVAEQLAAGVSDQQILDVVAVGPGDRQPGGNATEIRGSTAEEASIAAAVEQGNTLILAGRDDVENSVFRTGQRTDIGQGHQAGSVGAGAAQRESRRVLEGRSLLSLAPRRLPGGQQGQNRDHHTPSHHPTSLCMNFACAYGRSRCRKPAGRHRTTHAPATIDLRNLTRAGSSHISGAK
jgi:hypothetical protein